MSDKLPKEFLELLASITAKRARNVIDHILKHGYVTREELRDTYGYEQPPRAARDVREQGIPLETFKLKNSKGRTSTAYRFGDLSKIRRGVLSGRRVNSKKFKQLIADQNGNRCGICLTTMELRYLQVDHRIPFEVAGEGEGESNPMAFMLLCGSCNRAKSWSCENCPNWIEKKPAICQGCYWAVPTEYSHVATLELRRLDLTWNRQEVGDYDRLATLAKEAGMPLGEFVKLLVKKRKL